MGLFDFWLGTDVSVDWVAEPDLPICFNFDDLMLNGVGLGESLDGLSGLGPADDRRAARRGILRYYALGLQVEAGGDLVRSLELIWSWPNEPGIVFDSFAGDCVHEGMPWMLHRETNCMDIVTRLGKPDDEGRDELGLSYAYHREPALLRVEFDELDLLVSVAVYHGRVG